MLNTLGRVLPWACVVAAACGRIGFDPAGLDSTIDDRFNVAFVTSTSHAGDFGGLAGADAICAAAATDANLSGTYLAFISTSTVDAIDRFTGSRGWVRTDGAPVADTIMSMLAGGLFAPIDRGERATRVPDVTAPWTGSRPDGRFDAPNGSCADWTGGVVGTTGDANAGPPSLINKNGAACTASAPLFCFGVGRTTPIDPPHAASGRIVFLSTPKPLAGAVELDARCQNDAVAAGLPGTYLAAAATTTRSIRSRFSVDATPWVRPDGVQVAVDGPTLFGGDLLAPANQSATGVIGLAPLQPVILTGAPDANTLGTPGTTCSDWTFAGTSLASVGLAASFVAARVWHDDITMPCAASTSVLCLQQ